VIWVCKTQSGQEFTVRPEGTLETRKNYFKNKNNFFGKLLTVKFQNLTSLGIPRFPVGIVIRDYE
jgi:DNA ligase-1